ncbi:MAG: MlaD family protein [Parachlamydiaceae bacterium]
MADQAKNILIGVFVIVAMAIMIFILLFLHPSVGDEGQVLRVRFADVDKVTVGTRVAYGGKPVGEVVEIKEVKDPNVQERIGDNGYIYLYELILRVDSSVKVYNTDQISLRTSGLLGERSIEISPEPRKPGQELYLVNKEVLYAYEAGSVEETLKELKNVTDKVDLALTTINTTFNKINELHILEKVNRIAQNIEEITTAVNSPEKLINTIDNFYLVSKKLNHKIDKLDDVIAQVSSGLGKFDRAAENLQLVTKQLHAGEGTIGRLLMREDLYLQLNSLLNKGQTLFDDISTYGLLFQNNKQWQRLRARRANLLYKLSTPQEFKNYFSDEVNQINASIGRICMVLGETECCEPNFLEDGEFRKVFAELIRRVKAMEESLQMYNQQVVDWEVKKTELCWE